MLCLAVCLAHWQVLAQTKSAPAPPPSPPASGPPASGMPPSATPPAQATPSARSPDAQTPPAPAPPGQEQPPQQPTRPTIRSGVELVSLNVTVTNPEQSFITDLDRGDFQVFEDGVRQEITFFSRVQSPIALSLLIDTSASMDDKLGTAQEAAIGFAKRMRPEDLGQLIDFDNRVTILQQFTADSEALSRAIRQTAANGSTSLFNAVYIALKELKKVKTAAQDEIRRQAIVVLSDGEDTSSLVPFEEVLELAKRSDVAIYTIGIREKNAPATRGFNEADFVLRQFAQETGGRAFFPTSIAELPALYNLIGDELTSQYTLAYASRNPRRDGQWRRVVVRTGRPNTIARTKQGYYGPTE